MWLEDVEESLSTRACAGRIILRLNARVGQTIVGAYKGTSHYAFTTTSHCRTDQSRGDHVPHPAVFLGADVHAESDIREQSRSRSARQSSYSEIHENVPLHIHDLEWVQRYQFEVEVK